MAEREVEEEKRREGWNEVIFFINTGHLSFYLLLTMRERKEGYPYSFYGKDSMKYQLEKESQK